MGYSAVLAGLVISVQYIATLASRPWAGRIWWPRPPCTGFTGSAFPR
jgi:hypothetical protein